MIRTVASEQIKAPNWKRLSNAAVLALAIHLIAGICMVAILRNGLSTADTFEHRLEYLCQHRLAWTLGWLPWNAAAISILYFYHCFSEAHGTLHQSTKQVLRFAVLLAAAGVPADLSAECMQMTILPELARNVLTHAGAQTDLFLTINRISVMLTGYLANALYTLAWAVMLFVTRKEYTAAVQVIGWLAVLGGICLSCACLLDSVPAMFWSTVLLVPALLLWLLAVSIDSHRDHPRSSLSRS
jgi:hypothetical protein